MDEAAASAGSSRSTVPPMAMFPERDENDVQSGENRDSKSTGISKEREKLQTEETIVGKAEEDIRQGLKSVHAVNVISKANSETERLLERNDGQLVGKRTVEQDGKVDFVQLLSGFENFQELSERFRWMQTTSKEMLAMVYAELRNFIQLLEWDLEVQENINLELSDHYEEFQMEFNNLHSPSDSVDPNIAEMKKLEQLLGACIEDCHRATAELSKLERDVQRFEKHEEFKYEEVMVARLQMELASIRAAESNDCEAIFKQYKSIRESLQATISEELYAVQSAINRTKTELSDATMGYVSLTALFGIEYRDWSIEIENAKTARIQLEKAVARETAAISALRFERNQMDLEYQRLQQEIDAFHVQSITEMMQREDELSSLQMYLVHLATARWKDVPVPVDRQKINENAGGVVKDECPADFEGTGGKIPDIIQVSGNNQPEPAFDIMSDPVAEVFIPDPAAVDVMADPNLREEYSKSPLAFESSLSVTDDNDDGSSMLMEELRDDHSDQSDWSDFSIKMK